MKVDGRCHCGAITIEAEVDPANVAMCHCSDCQTMSGGAFRVNVLANEGTVKITGAPKVYEKTAESGRRLAQAFCSNCGTPIYSSPIGADPAVYRLRVATLRQRNELRPGIQVWRRSALPWIGDLDSIKAMETQPGLPPPQR